MDRIDAMKVFVAALDEGSLAGASRRLGRSPAAVSWPFLRAMSGSVAPSDDTLAQAEQSGQPLRCRLPAHAD
jgi:hypothetical protein